MCFVCGGIIIRVLVIECEVQVDEVVSRVAYYKTAGVKQLDRDQFAFFDAEQVYTKRRAVEIASGKESEGLRRSVSAVIACGKQGIRYKDIGDVEVVTAPIHSMVIIQFESFGIEIQRNDSKGNRVIAATMNLLVCGGICRREGINRLVRLPFAPG